MTNTRRSTSSLIVHEQPKSPISEKFRGIRSNIMCLQILTVQFKAL